MNCTRQEFENTLDELWKPNKAIREDGAHLPKRMSMCANHAFLNHLEGEKVEMLRKAMWELDNSGVIKFKGEK